MAARRKGNVVYNIMNRYTGEWQTYSDVTKWIDGTPMDDSKADGIIYRKKTTGYLKLNYTGPVNVKWFGAKGDGIQNDTPFVQAAIDAFQTGNVLNCGERFIFPRGHYLLANLIVKNGTSIYASQNAKDNALSNVGVTISGFGTPDYIIDVAAGSTNWTIEGLYIDGEFFNQPNMIAPVRLRGNKGFFIGNNVNRAAGCAVINEAGLVYIEKNGIYGWYGPAPTFTGINDFRGALHCGVLGDSYIYDNEIGAGLSYFTSTVTPRDPVNGRICALFLGGIFGGTSVISGNLFENGDRAVVIGNSLYTRFAYNRYELSAMGGLYIIGPMQFAVFIGESFADNSLTEEGAADDITIATGAAGNISFISPIFETLVNEFIPNSGFKVRYHITNFGSTLVDLVTPIIDTSYSTSGLINSTDIGTLPVRQVKGQYNPDDPQYHSVSTQNLPADTQLGYVKMTQGTDEDTQSLTGSVQFWTPQNTIAYSIGFSPKEYLSFIGYEANPIFAFSGNIALQKNGAANHLIWSLDGAGDSKLVLQGESDGSKQCSFTLDNNTGVTKIAASGNIQLGSQSNFIIQPNGLTLITATPTSGTTSNSFLLGRNTTTFEQVIIDPSVFFNSTTIQSANLVYAGPTGGAAVAPVFRSLVTADLPNLDASKITTGTFATARLGAGIADATTALFGDQTYKTVLTDATAFIQKQVAADQLASFRTQGTASIVPLAIGGGFKVDATTSQLTIESGGTALARVRMYTDGVSQVQLRVYDSFNKGFVYEGNYSAAGITDDRWIPDYGAVKAYVASAGGGTGTVTSVGLSAPSVFSVGSSPVTGSGTLALTFATGQTANQVLASPNGSTGAVGLRSLVAADIPSLPFTQITGTIPVLQGGTALTAVGSNGTFLSSNGTILSYRTLLAADIPVLDTAKITTGTFSTALLGSGTANSTVFLRGDSTFSNTLAGPFNASGKITATITTEQFRAAYDASNYMNVVVASSGSTTFDLTGTSPLFSFGKGASFTAGIAANNVGFNLSVVAINAGTGVTTTQYLFGGATTVNYRVGVRGSGANTLAAASSGANFVVGDSAITTASSGTHAVLANAVIKGFTITSGGASTVTNAASLYIDAAPTGGSANWASYIAAGNAYFGGQVKIAGGSPGSNKVLTSDSVGLATWQTPTTPTTFTIRSTSANDTLTLSDYGLIVDTTGGAVNVGLPTAASSTGKQYWIINIGSNSSNSLTIDPNGSELINGNATYATNLQYKSVMIISTGTAWYIMSSNV